MTCETVQALIRTEGSVILVYRSRGVLGLPIYDRYVRGQQDCEPARSRGGGRADRRQAILPGPQMRRQRDLPHALTTAFSAANSCLSCRVWRRRRTAAMQVECGQKKSPAEAGLDRGSGSRLDQL